MIFICRRRLPSWLHQNRKGTTTQRNVEDTHEQAAVHQEEGREC